MASSKQGDIARAVVDAAQDAIVTIDAESRVIHQVNAAVETLFGYSPEELMGRNITVLMRPEDGERHEAGVRRYLETGVRRLDWRRTEVVGLHKDGRLVPLEISYSEFARDGDRYITGVMRDVSDRVRSDWELQLFRTLLDHSVDAIEVIDPATGRFLDVNRRTCRDLGYSRVELQSMSVRDIDPTFDDAARQRAMAELQAHGFVARLGRYRRKDGSSYPVEIHVSLVRLDRDYIIAVARDITERMRADEALRASRDLLGSIVEHAPVRIFWKDADSRFLGCNSAFARDAGLSAPEELIGKDDFSMAWRDEAELYVADDRRVMSSGASKIAYEEPQTTPDGKTIWLRTSKVALRDAAGTVVGVLGIYDDITEQKRLEEQYRQAQKMEAVGVLAGGVAHDFNNMLTLVSGNCEVLLSELPDWDPRRELVEEIHQAGRHAASLTRQLLAFSRQTVLAPRLLDLNELVREHEKMLRRLIGEDVTLTVALHPVLEPVKVDRGHIGQVLMNLAVNARDAMPTGGRLTIETGHAEIDEKSPAWSPEAEAGRYVVLSVSDSGAGMTPEVKARIFEPFFTTKGPGKGTGLGLATVYGIVKQSGGTISVESEPGRGTVFRLHFPVTYGSTTAASLVPSDAPTGRGHETILVVEDEDAVRAMVRRALRQAGYHVLDAGRAADALRLVAEHRGPLDLVLADVVMPEMGGPELVERLTEIRPGIKVLYMSGYTDDAVVRHGVLQSEVAFLQKPFTLSRLTSRVRERLDAPSP